ncbi:MAG: DUF2207 domain-containing protein [Tissierellia bacterium]|nr:DUF2207 domain-containing protein [Tissierellia bacterium]
MLQLEWTNHLMMLSFELSHRSLIASNLVIFALGIFGIHLYHVYLKKTDPQDGEILTLDYDQSGYLIRGGNYAPDFIIATLLSMIGKRAVDLRISSFITRKGNPKINYVFSARSKDRLSPREKSIYDIFFSQKEEISSRELNRMRREEGANYNALFQDYLEMLEEEMIALGLKDRREKGKLSMILFLLAILSFIVSLISFASGFYFGLLNLILSLILFYLCLITAGNLPKKGKVNYHYYQKLRDGLETFQDSDGEESLILYAIAYGLPYEKVRSIKEKIGGNTYHFYFDGTKESNFYKILREALVGNMKKI